MLHKNKQLLQFTAFLAAAAIAASAAYHAVNRNVISANAARQHMKQGRYSEAATIYERLRADGFQTQAVSEKLADIYLSLGRPEEARSALQSLVSSGDGAEFYRLRQLAATALWLGMHEEAVHEYKEALRLEPQDRSARLGLARALSWSGNLEDAVVEYRRLVPK